MSEYEFVDGPLAGQSLTSSEPHLEGEVLAVEVIDLAQYPEEVPRFDYYVESPPLPGANGRLRHASLRGRPDAAA